MQTTQFRFIYLILSILILIAKFASDPLVTPCTKSPTTIFGRWSIAGNENNADITGCARVLEGGIQLVHGLRAESISHLWSIKCDSNGSVFLVTMIGDVLKCEMRYGRPDIAIKNR